MIIMNRNIFIVSVMACTVLAGCRQYLDVKPQGKVLPETEEEFAAVMNYRLNNIESGSYDDVLGNAALLAQYEAFADDLDANIQIGNLPIYAGTQFNSNYGLYTGWYEVIKDCNIIAENMADKDSDEAWLLLAAARGMKGVCYYNLLRNYCKAYDPATASEDPGLCIVDHFAMDEAPARSDLETTVRFVISTLKSSADMHVTDAKYMFTEDVADAYLAKAYFWGEQWQNALDICEDLALKYPILNMQDFETMISSEYEKTSGVIVRSRINDNSTVSSSTYRQAVSDIRSRPLNGDLVRLYSQQDIRRRLYFDSDRKNLKIPVARVREGEIYLMMAECYAHLGNEGEALRVLNEIRANRIENYVPYTMETLPEVDGSAVITCDATGAPLTKLMQAILNERRMEMYLEGDRWFELKRNGSPSFWVITDQIGIFQKYTTEPYMYTFPINKDDVDLKDYIIQNEGYVEYL